VKNLDDLLEELGKIDGSGKWIMPEMPRAPMVGLTTGATDLSVLQDPHSRVKQSSDSSFRRGRSGNLYHRSATNLLGTEDPKLNPHNDLRIGGV